MRIHIYLFVSSFSPWCLFKPKQTKASVWARVLFVTSPGNEEKRMAPAARRRLDPGAFPHHLVAWVSQSINICWGKKNPAVWERRVKPHSHGVENVALLRDETLTQGLGSFLRGKRHLFLSAAPTSGCSSSDDGPQRWAQHVSRVVTERWRHFPNENWKNVCVEVGGGRKRKSIEN